jgi:hypothetical protein
MKQKLLFAGFIAGVCMLAISMISGMVFEFVFPAVKAEYQNEVMFRPWTDPRMFIFFLAPLMQGFLLVWVWTKVHTLFPGPITMGSGIRYGLVYWITTFPGMVISYSSFRITVMMVAGWSIGALLQGLVAGIILWKMLK